MNARSDGQPKFAVRVYYPGISWRQRRKPFIVKFKRNKRTVYVGSFAKLLDAEIAARRFLGEYAP
jgi:hypothetical protein